MNRKFLNMRHLGLGLLGLMTGCNSGDVNFPDVNVGWPSGSTGTIQFRYTTYDVAEGSVVNISVLRVNGSSGIARVDYATVDGSAVAGSDYGAASGTLTWPSGTSGNQSISIRIADDSTAEAAESFSVRLSNPSVAVLGTNRTTTVTIADNDTSAAEVTGKIAAMDALVVNGIRYETDSTSVYFNELPASVSDLKLGQVVTLHGDVNFSDATGTADEIRYYTSVIGPVENVNVAGGKLVVMGQDIRTHTDTVFGAGTDLATYDGLAVGTVVEVSGFADTDGTIDATRIDRTADSDRLQLTGRVSALDLASFRFAINGLMLDYSNATLIDLCNGLPADGMSVRATGTMSGDAFVVEQLLAAPLAGSEITE